MKKINILFNSLIVINITISLFFFLITGQIWRNFPLIDFWDALWVISWYSLFLNILMFIFRKKKIILKTLYFQMILILLLIIYIIYDYDIVVLISSIKENKNFVYNMVYFLKKVFIDKFFLTFLLILEIIIPLKLR